MQTEKIQKDFNKYGENAFYIEEITRGELADMFLIEKELTRETVINGYNTVIGGGDEEERRNSCMEFQKKLKNNPEYAKEFYALIGARNKGKLVSEETRKKQSLSRKGKKWEDWRKKDRSIQFAAEGNPNFGNFKYHLNLETGIFYTRDELAHLFGTTISGLSWMKKTSNQALKSFIKL